MVSSSLSTVRKDGKASGILVCNNSYTDEPIVSNRESENFLISLCLLPLGKAETFFCALASSWLNNEVEKSLENPLAL